MNWPANRGIVTVGALVLLLSHPGLAGGGPDLAVAWEEMLARALDAQPDDKEALEGVRSAATSSPTVKRLAQALLDEWDVPKSDDRFKVPIVAWLPPIDFNKLPAYARQVSSPVVIVTGIVGRQGRLETPALRRSSGSPLLDQAALDAAGDALFRPARKGRRYVPAQAAITVHVDPR